MIKFQNFSFSTPNFLLFITSLNFIFVKVSDATIITKAVADESLIIIPPYEEESSPRFVVPASNTSVHIGQNALLVCVVDNLQNYKVGWVKVSTQTILTVHQSVITKDSRISLSYNDHRSWYLHIRDVKETDRGWYMCQINTDPLTSQSVFLQVLVPPKILNEETNTDLIARELSDITLKCKSDGYPEPYVMWRRGDGNDFNYNGHKVNVVDGEEVRIKKVSRLHMGIYYCVAQNGISPPASKKINLTVHFPPILHIPNQLVGVAIGSEITLLCISEAYPKSINYWLKGTGELLVSGNMYGTEFKSDVYTTNMMLTIKNVTYQDYGIFTCASVNPLGSTDGNIKLYEVTSPITDSITETTDLALSIEVAQTINGTSYTEEHSDSIIHGKQIVNLLFLTLGLIFFKI